MSDQEDEGGIIDFIAKIIITCVLIYIVAYFTGYQSLLNKFVKDNFGSLLKGTKAVGAEVVKELDKRGVTIPDELRKATATNNSFADINVLNNINNSTNQIEIEEVN
ncbi:MAG: hypothetical protein IJT36_04360 [Alphaproteobacteria bacterium]|nr:hypothetical protein [Alphaproteobacteria bacterium]